MNKNTKYWLLYKKIDIRDINEWGMGGTSRNFVTDIN